MNKEVLTLAIYGIQDCNNTNTPTVSHDHSVAIMKDGKMLYHIQLERLNRQKHSNKLPDELFQLLKSKKLLEHELDIVFVDNILGRSFINKEGNIRFEAPINDKLQQYLEIGQVYWLNKVKNAFALNHELAHLGSCLLFHGEFKENSLLIHYDGGASKSNFSAWTYKNDTLQLLEADWEMKHLSSLFNANALMFGIIGTKPNELNSVPGKLMGFASFGRHRQDIEEWLIKNDFFKDVWGSKNYFFEKANTDFGIKINHLSQKDPFIQDIVATTHAYFVRESLVRFKKLQIQTNAEFLYYSGGTALSIVLNTEIINNNLFKQVYIPPCCNDSGLAAGAAAFLEWQKGNTIQKHNAYLNNWDIENYQSDYNKNDIESIGKLLSEENIIGICNDFAEIGPRALGNRSILSLASSKDIAKKASMVIKKREWYRPVAPIMLERNAKHFTGLKLIDPLSEYMLLDFKILPEFHKELSGALHVNNTARIQTISHREQNPFMHDLLEYLDRNYKIKALINTSFNAAGEPIIHTIEDALKSAKKMNLDALVINGKLQSIND